MLYVVSAGGLVIRDHQLLMLKKKNGDWVLPKGRIETGETLEQTAVREVKEETNVTAEIIDYLGVTTYTFSNYWTKYQAVEKTVSWYLMKPLSDDLIPLRQEGFVEAKYLPIHDAVRMAKYDDERKVVELALKSIEE